MTRTLTARWLVEYARRPLNLVLLVAVPVVFVTLSAGALSDFADILGGVSNLGEVEAATAGWAAAVLAGVAAFFQVSLSRDADRRLAAAGAGAVRVVFSRLLSTLALALLASVGSLVALGVRTDLPTTPRVVGATVLFALIYTGIGLIVGALVRSEMNGSLIVVFAWIFDVFFGPAMGGSAWFIRLFPLHYPTLVITDVASGHSGALGDLGISLLWAAIAMSVAIVSLNATTRISQRTRVRRPPGLHRAIVALVAATRQLRRMPVMWILIVGLPVAFITASIAVTPDDPTPVELVENGRRGLEIVPMSDVHGAVMVPITIGFLASLAGLFVILDSAQADRRLSLTRFRPSEILTVRMIVIATASLVAAAVSIAVTAVSFDPVSWPTFVFASVLVALTYATIGAIVGPLFGRLGGLYFLLVLP
ncbi:MAG: ABC transporter permease, partial [Acidimicrobiia bacterium]|nr:ABC transporter permease [Acidimicrobiia bacterium]